MYFMCQSREKLVNLKDVKCIWIDDHGLRNGLNTFYMNADFEFDMRDESAERGSFEEFKKALNRIASYSIIADCKDDMRYELAEYDSLKEAKKALKYIAVYLKIGDAEVVYMPEHMPDD